MPRKEFASRKQLETYAEQTGSVPVIEHISVRERMLSPNEYEIVDVRTAEGARRPVMLIPKPVLKAMRDRDAPFYQALLPDGVAKAARKGKARSRG